MVSEACRSCPAPVPALKVLTFERRAGPLPRTAARATAKHPTQKFVDPTAEPTTAATA